MTTISSSRRRKKLSPRTAWFLIAVTILLCAGLLWRNAAANLVWHALSPLLSARNSASVASAGFFGQFQNASSLAQENAQLRQALASTSTRLAARDYVYAQNLDLKAMLGRKVSDPVVLAAVILRPPGTPYGTLMLDAGLQDGVREGDLVSSEGSTYIGRVSRAYDTASRVTLFSAPGETYQGLLRGTIPVSLEGEGVASMRGEVPSGMAVSAGDPVVLPSVLREFA